MRKIKVFLFLCIFLSLSIGLIAQNTPTNNNIVIHFAQQSTWTRDNFEVDIEKQSTFIKIKYSFLESPPALAVKNDTAIKALSIKLRSKNLSSKDEHTMLEEIHKLLERYTIYHKESIILAIDQHKVYNDILMRFANTSTETLEKDNQSRIMDVDYTTCNITLNGTTKKIYGTVDETVALNSAIIGFIKQTINLDENNKLTTVSKIREKYHY